VKQGGGSKKAGFSSLFSGFKKGEGAGGFAEEIADEPFALLPLRELVLFPSTVVPIFITAQPGMAALDEALRRDRRLFAACLKKREPAQGGGANGGAEEAWPVGTVVRILQHLRLPDGAMRVVLQGEYRGRVLGSEQREGFSIVRVAPIGSELFGEPPLPEDAALARAVQRSFAQYAELSKKIGSETLLAVERAESPERLANLICNSSQLKPEKKVELLGVSGARERLQAVLETLERENEIFGIQKNISGKVRSRMDRRQREYYLNEQLREIKKELGREKGPDARDEFAELERRIAGRRPPQEVLEKAAKEIARLRRLQALSPEAGVLRGYLEWIADLPWSESSADSGDLDAAQKILDEGHFNMLKAKDRIMEFIAVRQLIAGAAAEGGALGEGCAIGEGGALEEGSGEGGACGGAEAGGFGAAAVKGPILCFVGPPGTGKTSLGKSVAKALGRRFARISLGGLRDEAEIRGHRKTYVGALPGKIIQSMRRAGAANPVILLDEIDKMSSDFRGDPANALLEVLDPEQNANFADHYMEVPYDLSRALFIATANSLHGIPYPLLDRMEIIEVPGYGENEKLAIAKQFLVPKELRENGLSKARVRFSDEALLDIIRYWTMESGVRGLEREIARCARRIARKALASGYGAAGGGAKGRAGRAGKAGASGSGAGGGAAPAARPISAFSKTVKSAGLERLLGRRRYKSDVVFREPKIGVTCGLAWTESGGVVFPVESAVSAGRGEIVITGNLGDVMRESVRIALSYLRGAQGLYRVREWGESETDFHIHVPEGAIPKDGPSAGVAIAASLLSTLCEAAPLPGIAMTGELTLTGRVLPIGGLKEKLLAAIRAGMEKALLPEGNRDEWEELDRDIRGSIAAEFVGSAAEAFALAFDGGILRSPPRAKAKAAPKAARQAPGAKAPRAKAAAARKAAPKASARKPPGAKAAKKAPPKAPPKPAAKPVSKAASKPAAKPAPEAASPKLPRPKAPRPKPGAAKAPRPKKPAK